MSKSFYEKIYYSCPVILQNILVSLVGLLLKRKRKGGNYPKYLSDIILRNSFSSEEFNAYQVDEVNRLISVASKRVPYYQEKFSNIDFEVSTVEDVARLPLLMRDALKNNPSNFVMDGDGKSLVVHTTGSTGSPLQIVCDTESRQKNYAFFDAYLVGVGIDVNKRHIVIGGRVVVSPEEKSPPFWRYSYFQKSLLMSSYHLKEQFLKAYIDKIRSFKPEYIESYPSSIYIIAKYIIKNNISLRVGAIVTSAEMLFEEQREVIEKAFNCKVYDQYGCAEMSLFVAQCSKGKYHVRPDYGVFEIVDDSGGAVLPGVVGDVVCTGFINKKMPLIRYKIGDRAVWSEFSCDCGLNTPVVDKIYGRKDDVLITADGRQVGRMSPVMKGLPVIESQYIQYKKGEVVVNIVPDTSYKQADELKIIKAVSNRLGSETKVDIKLVSELVKGRGGKLKNVISHLKNSQDVNVGNQA